MLSEFLKLTSKKLKHSYPKDYGPRVDRRLYSYFRQYFGLINDQQQKIVHINCSWDRRSITNLFGDDDRLSFDSDYSIVLDGGSYYWEVDVNLEEKTISGFGVHGVAELKIKQQHRFLLAKNQSEPETSSLFNSSFSFIFTPEPTDCLTGTRTSTLVSFGVETMFSDL